MESKKQSTIIRSNSEAEYRAMAHRVGELICLKTLLLELGLPHPDPMEMFCNNQSAIYIAANPIFHEWTKHIEVDYHFVRDAILKKLVITPFIHSADQTADIFTKAFSKQSFQSCCFKLDL